MADDLVLTGVQVCHLLYDLEACDRAHGWAIFNQYLDSRAMYAAVGPRWLVWLGARLECPGALGAACDMVSLWLAQQPQDEPGVVAALQALGVVIRWRRGLETREGLLSLWRSAIDNKAIHPIHGGEPALYLAKCLGYAAYYASRPRMYVDEVAFAAVEVDRIVGVCLSEGAIVNNEVAAEVVRRHLPYEVLATVAAKFQAEQPAE
ncbi:MAG TPA: hypothetical protein VFS21_03035 [Roseiflexaceae bacterium]|nr:hypothetical protein [Roseiflexaceae bacterium]